MKAKLALLLAGVLVASLAFAEKPSVKEARITPTEAAVGDSISIMAVFTGEKSDIREIYGYAREYPYDSPRISLQPAEAASNNLWHLETTIPWDAPSETFHLDFTAIDKDGKEIVSEDMADTAIGKTFTLLLTVK